MNWVDGLVVVGIGLGAVRGFTTGVMRQVAAILGVVVGFILGLQLMNPVGRLLVRSLPIAEALAPLVGFILVFLGVRLVVFAARRVVESILRGLHLSVLDRVGGVAFGAFQGALLLSVLFMVLSYVGVPDAATRREATFYQPVAAVLPHTWDAVARHVPALRRASEQFGRRVEEELPDSNP